MSNLLTELKRRNVFKVAAAYAVVGWLTIQVTESLAPRMALPDWVPSLIILLLLVGLPIAIIFAWAFELTPEGIKKSKDVDISQSITHATSRKIDFIIIGALVLIIGGMGYERLTLESTPIDNAANAQDIASIAVLPFADMSPDGDQEYFSDGISEEILNVLAKTPDLHITSRSSAFSFKGKDFKISDIAKELGVDHVLEGSVRKSGTTVRITAQLIQADGDKHLWSETYDRDLSDIFAVQDEISAAIVAALKEELGLAIVESSTKSVSINPEAFDLYLHGQQSFKQNSFASLETAIASFKAALALEPDFQAARIALAEVLTRQIITGSRSDQALLDEAEVLLNIVLVAEPDSGKAFYALANVARIRNDRAEQLLHIKQAYSLNPNDADIITVYATSVGPELGEGKARELFARAERLDPLNSTIAFIKAEYLLSRLQAYGEAEEALRRAMVLNPEVGDYPFFLGRLHGYWMGDVAAAVSNYELTLTLDPSDPDGLIYLSKAYLSLGDSDRALKYANQALSITPTSGEALEVKVGALIALGRTDEALKLVETSFDNADIFYRRASKEILAVFGVKLLLDKHAYDRAEAFLFARRPELKELDYSAPPQSLNGRVYASALLAAIYRVVGKEAEARRITDRNKSIDKEMLLGNKPRLDGFDYISLAYVGMGRLRDDEVIGLLEASINGGALLDWRSYINMDPVFMPLHEHPRYIALTRRIEAEMARQLALVHAREIKE